jgi:hypothetical protein
MGFKYKNNKAYKSITCQSTAGIDVQQLTGGTWLQHQELRPHTTDKCDLWWTCQRSYGLTEP